MGVAKDGVGWVVRWHRIGHTVAKAMRRRVRFWRHFATPKPSAWTSRPPSPGCGGTDELLDELIEG
jgi:hypothetical protein